MTTPELAPIEPILDSAEAPAQPWLLPYENPLKRRFKPEFFREIPKTAGVYLMIGEQGALLYVGKAKNLRARLNSYRQAQPGRVSRKVIRLLNLVQEIRVEHCDSEKDALLLENRFLRELRPPFNRINTRPDTYYFLGIRYFGDQVRFRLTTHCKRQGDVLFGAFKGRASVRGGYSALLRLIWAAENRPERFEFPTLLTRPSPPHIHTLSLPAGWAPFLKSFLNGKDTQLLVLLTERLLDNPAIPRFAYHVIQDDMNSLQEFFDRCLQRNRELKRNQGLRCRLIPQHQIDDLLVLELARRGKIEK